MPQQFLHHLELSPHTSQQSRVRVPEGVPSEPLLNSDTLCGGADVFAQDCLAPVWSPTPITLACKKTVIRFGVRTPRISSFPTRSVCPRRFRSRLATTRELMARSPSIGT